LGTTNSKNFRRRPPPLRGFEIFFLAAGDDVSVRFSGRIAEKCQEEGEDDGGADGGRYPNALPLASEAAGGIAREK
jgi:hypothetical protein